MATTNLIQLPAVRQPSQASGQYHQDIPLAEHAARLYPDHQFNQDAWIKAVGYLRSHNPSMWALDRVADATPETNRY